MTITVFNRSIEQEKYHVHRHPPRSSLRHLTESDLRILAEVPGSLNRGRQLRDWWTRTNSEGTYKNKFATAASQYRPDFSFAFLDHAPIDGKRVPVLGDMQRLYYDNIKTSGGESAAVKRAMVESTRVQLQEYILRYFARTSSSSLPKYLDPGGPTPPNILNPLGLCQRPGTQEEGFGQTQVYYKLTNGAVGKFHDARQETIIDLREIGPKYEWIVGDAKMFGFLASYMPLGPNLPYAEIPLREAQLAIISADFITNTTASDPDAEIAGEYGYGLATLKTPVDTTLVGYGPGFFDVGFMTFTWKIFNAGAIRTDLVFCANQPDVLINPALNPIAWGIKAGDLLTRGRLTEALDQLPRAVRAALIDPIFGTIAATNLLTLDKAAKDLNLSQEGIMKLFLFYHYTAIYTLVSASVATWRQVPDWLDTENLPLWVRKGTGG